ncbi:hypothetical protein PLCT1_02701 [Planctomycetaceae bacterium]|nr:hypothetical protein PLCT1_02701 [Planctomycetaceae bacterium]
MSNPFRKQAAHAELPTHAQCVELVSAAIQKLYEARGGLDIEAQIDVARLDVENARVCREAEAARLKQNPNALREKGERPIVTVSEDRLHSRELTRLHELRDFKRGQCRTQIQEAINRNKPRTLAQWREVLDTAAKDIDDVARMLPQEPSREALEEFEAALATSAALAQSGKMAPEQSKALLEAAQRRDGSAMVAVLGKLPPELRAEFESGLAARLKSAA